MRWIPLVFRKLAAVVVLLAPFGQAIAQEECATLWAGQNSDVGAVCVSVDSDNLYIRYETDSPWLLEDMHLWLDVIQSESGYDITADKDCSAFADMPMTRPVHYTCGNAIPGRFPFKAEGVYGTSHTFTIPRVSLGEVCDEQIMIVAHADVVDGSGEKEGAWAAYEPNHYILTGDDIGERPRKNWALYFIADINCSGYLKCETAFAQGKTTFNDWTSSTGVDLQGDKRWGWVLGPFSPPFLPRSESFELWAGAGQNDTEKGGLAGRVTVNTESVFSEESGAFDSTDVRVSFEMAQDWHVTNEAGGTGTVHVFVGAAEEFTTTAPGQYGYQAQGSLGQSALDIETISTSANPFFVVAHAEVCEYIRD